MASRIPSTPPTATVTPDPMSKSTSSNLELQESASPSAGNSGPGGVASPQVPSAHSASSDLQLGYVSAASDLSGDRVFPIRSVVKVEPSSPAADDSKADPMDSENHGPGIPVRILGKTRAEHSVESRKSYPGPSSPSSSSQHLQDHSAQPRRGRAFSGPYSSVQADAARKGTIAPLNIDVYLDKDDDEESELPEKSESHPDPSAGSDSHGRSYQLGDDDDAHHVATRFKHVETQDGHIIIEGRDGVLQRCEDEPIHIPGAVQGFGVLLAMREDSDGRFIVHYVSENSQKLLGYTPQRLFSLSNFLDIFTDEQQNNLLDHIDFIRDEDADPAVDGPEVFSISLRARNWKRTLKLWCAIHINPAHPDLIICEFESDDDQQYPLRPVDDDSPGVPHDSLHGNPTMEEIEESTEVLSKPLRVLRSARKKRGEQGAMQVFDIMAQVQEQLSSATTLQTFLKVLVGIVKELTGFHRVMMYQFDAYFNGKVVAEIVDTTKTVDLYHGLHFPASDIPKQARDLYKLNKVRLLYDRELESARIVCRSMEDLEVPLDMSHAHLRALSPIHLKYLANMGVRASMSISINAFNELWGLVACHSYGPHGMRVSFPIRKMCRLVGDTASRNIERLSYASRLQARKLINAAPSDGNPAGYIIASSEDLLRLFDADFGLLSIKGETKILGEVEQSQEALAMLEYLRMRKLTSVLASQDIGEDFPDLHYAPGFEVIAGLLYVPLSVGGDDFIVFFRKGQVKQVKWAGNPYEKTFRAGTAGYLEPRTSFKIWHETVAGKCREWVEEHVETAAVLCLVYGKFIEVWRQKEAALQNSKLKQLLLANSAHEVRTPLNAIINYLEIALEGSLDKETRDNLARSHSASKSLIYVINDLLDLTKTEEGQHLVNDEPFELRNCVREATDPFKIDAERKRIEYEVILHPGLPRLVHGDGRRVRQAISNITANAVAHTNNGYVRVDVFVSEVRVQEVLVDIIVTDSGEGMSPRQLDALFRELEQVSTEEPDSSASSPERKSSEMGTLGLGLAVVARIVRNMDGQIRLKSAEGIGSRFVIKLPFPLPQENTDPPQAGDNSPTITVCDEKSMSGMKSFNTASKSDLLVFDANGISIGADREDAPRGRERTGSGGGMTADGQKSRSDRLFETMREPLSLTQTNDETSKTGEASSVRLGHEQTQPDNQYAAPAPLSLNRLRSAEKHKYEMPVRAIKVPDDGFDVPAPIESSGKDQYLLHQQERPPQSASSISGGQENQSLSILVAEDDPINLKLLKKRLEKAGHEVHHAVNGEDCALLYEGKPSMFEVILMDMQMPIVDGLTSTRMIRAIEKSTEDVGLSPLAADYGRVPIFAVSASLVEHEYEKYTDSGFDGWILKPIDFKRLMTLLKGIQDMGTRDECLYTPGHWERGGWFGTFRSQGPSSHDSSDSH